MMRHVETLLAAFRDVDSEKQAEVHTHLHACPRCRRVQDAYERQDEMLRGLPEVQPTAAWAAGVRSRVYSEHRAWLRLRRTASAIAGVLLLFVILSAGAIGASAQALPGDIFYPVKRAVEEFRVRAVGDEEQLAAYRAELAERRLREAHLIIELRRSTSLEFGGILEQASGGDWRIAGVPVFLDLEALGSPEVQPGDPVIVDAEALSGELKIIRIERRTQSLLPPAPTPSATPSVPPATVELQAEPPATPAVQEVVLPPTPTREEARSPSPAATRTRPAATITSTRTRPRATATSTQTQPPAKKVTPKPKKPTATVTIIPVVPTKARNTPASQQTAVPTDTPLPTATATDTLAPPPTSTPTPSSTVAPGDENATSTPEKKDGTPNGGHTPPGQARRTATPTESPAAHATVTASVTTPPDTWDEETPSPSPAATEAPTDAPAGDATSTPTPANLGQRMPGLPRGRP